MARDGYSAYFRALLLLFLTAFCFTSAHAAAQDRGAEPTVVERGELDRPRDAPQGYGALLFQMVIVVLGVCLLAYLVLRYGLKRFLAPDADGSGKMEVVARLPIEPRRSILVVRVGTRHIVVGSSEGGMDHLGDLGPADVAALADGDSESGFASIFRRTRAPDALDHLDTPDQGDDPQDAENGEREEIPQRTEGMAEHESEG